MKEVWIVENGYDSEPGSYVDSVWATKAAAELRAKELKWAEVERHIVQG